MPRGNSKFVLIWWTESKQIDIIPSSQLPKNNRGVESLVKLSWQDPSTKKFQRYGAKILAFGASESELQEIVVDSEGQICAEPKKSKRLVEGDEKFSLSKSDTSTTVKISASTKSRTNSHPNSSRIKTSTKDSVNSSESSEEEPDNARNTELSKFRPIGKVTLRDVKHIERFAAFMRSQYKLQQKKRNISNGRNMKNKK